MRSWRWSFLLFLSAAFLRYDALVDHPNASESLPRWEVLTWRNYSSQIRLHRHILLIVTVPWSGESRSIMRNLAHYIYDKPEELGQLKLMVVYRNTERLLAEMLHVSEETTLFFCHHSKQYKYQGQLRVQNILSSVQYLMSLQLEDIPFKSIHSKEDLDNFFHSTDKAVLLLEFCGWSSKLLLKSKKDAAVQPWKDFPQKVDVAGDYHENGLHVSLEKEKKVSENGELTCVVENGFPSTHLFEQFFCNGSSSKFESRNASSEICTEENFQHFETFFLKLVRAGREFLLPPERQRFGLVSERSLLPFLGISNQDSWSLMVRFSGCANCSMIFQEADHLQEMLQMQHPLVAELDCNSQHMEHILPGNRPSVVLFIDRASESSETRGKSKSSLENLRKFVQNNQLPHMMSKGQVLADFKGLSSQLFLGYQKSMKRSKVLLNKDSSVPKLEKVQNKMTIMFVNEGESLSIKSPDKQGNVPEVLAQLLQTNPARVTKENRISIIAKEVGFQLLSNDFEIQVIDSLALPKDNDGSYGKDIDSSTSKDQPSEHSEENFDNDNLNEAIMFDDKVLTGFDDDKVAVKMEEIEAVSQQNQELDSFSDANLFASALAEKTKDGTSHRMIDCEDSNHNQVNGESISAANALLPKSITISESDGNKCNDHSNLYSGDTPVAHEESLLEKSFSEPIVGDAATEHKNSMVKVMVSDLNNEQQMFQGSFFFCDGGYRLLKTLTEASNVPSLVMIDPISQRHYIFSEKIDITYSSIENFILKFTNGSLTPYEHSQLSIRASRESLPQPPYVNLDFHEANSIPQVTVGSFCKVVVGTKDCKLENSSSNINNGSAWTKDVLVLFSTSSCGFCQRMEVIVREVYRALKDFTNMLKSHVKHRSFSDAEENIITSNSPPSIFLMDCTLNDCASTLNRYGKEEVFPTLLLFPAENKHAISYEDNISVGCIFEFLVSYGGNSHYLNLYRGFLWNHEKGDQMSSAFSNQDHTTTDIKHNEFLLKTPSNRHRHVEMQSSSNLRNEEQYVVPGSIFSATEKLLNVFPFNNSTVVIVAAEQNQGFQGLILNKKISWDAIKDLDEDVKHLKHARLSYGGPVRDPTFPLVSLAIKETEGYREIRGRLHFGNPVATSLAIEAIRLGHQSASDFWFFWGYSSWEWNQLFEEFSQGAWHLSNYGMETLDWPDS